MVHAGGLVRGDGALVQAKPLDLVVSICKTAGQGVVGVQDQLRLGMDGGQNGVVDPLGVAVPGQLVPVQVGHHELRGVEELEAVGGVALVGLDEQHVGPDPTAHGGVGQHQGGDALDLVGALFVVHHVLAVGPQDGGDHLHGGGLSVGAGDGNDVGRQLDPGQNVRADF